MQLKMPTKEFGFVVFCLLFQLSATEVSPWPFRELRGAWVATVANIDWPSSQKLSTHQQQQELDTIIQTVQKLNFNAIVFQVRTSGDALYNSSLEPWSCYLTGTQGQAPDPFWDPLAYLIEKSHTLGIEVHAWFNPYRARAGSTSRKGLAPNHMANLFPQYAYAYGDSLWMDPGAVVVRNHITAVYIDVVKRYDIDAIHMDDYFYPYPVQGHDFPDSNTYSAYTASGGTLSLKDWRRHNVNTMIQVVKKEIHTHKSHVKFGISPFGIWKPHYPHGIHGLSAYDELYADSRKWFQEAWVDYLSPQLYWKIDPPAQSYTALLDWWLEQNPRKRHLYAGNYAAQVVSSHWDVQEITNQVGVSRSRRSLLSFGNIQFSMKYFVRNSRGISDAFKPLYPTPALTPEMPWLNVAPPHAPTNVTSNGHSLKWSRDFSNSNFYWSIYKESVDAWLLYKVVRADVTSVANLEYGMYALSGVNRAGIESRPAKIYVQVVIIG